jgi:hypothetical protein
MHLSEIQFHKTHRNTPKRLLFLLQTTSFRTISPTFTFFHETIFKFAILRYGLGI